MITPSFALTATERVLPRMALDFTTATLDPRVTFTRAGNTATVVNSSGVVAPINADLPRFDFDPVTLTCKGLLIEETRTNLILYSEQFDNIAWTKTDTTITTNVINSPSGTQTADLATEGSAGTSNTNQGLSITANSSNTFSMFFKRGNTNWIRFVMWDSLNNSNRISAWVNLSTGALGASVVNGGTATGGAASITNFGNGWYRVTLSGAVNNAAILINCLFLSATADGSTGRVNGATYYVWGAQTEAGTFPTSYIPTVASTVTRTADVATMTGTNFSNWFNVNEGAFGIEFIQPYNYAGNTYIFSCNSATDLEQLSFLTDTTPRAFWYCNAGGTNVTVLAAGNITLNQTTKQVAAYKLDNYAMAVNGGTTATDTSAAVPTGLTTVYFGTNVSGGNRWSGWVRKLNFWPQRLINAELQAFSK